MTGSGLDDETAAGWRERAACRLEDSRLFDLPDWTDRQFGDGGRARIEAAKAVCAGCPVAAHCLVDARASKGSGVRAGHLLDHGKPYRPRDGHAPRSSTVCPPGRRPHVPSFPTSHPQRRQQPRLSREAVARQPDVVSMEAIARDELAAVYGATVPEHHGNAQPLPAVATNWERARLLSAARRLRGEV